MGASRPTPIDRRDRTEPLNRRRNRGCAEMSRTGLFPTCRRRTRRLSGLCGFYRAAAESRGELPLAALIAAAMSVDRPSSPISTYISIGFLPILIYAGTKLGGYHNMLLTVVADSTSEARVAGAGHGLLRAVVDTRTLATKCCHNVWQRGSAWLQIAATLFGRDFPAAREDRPRVNPSSLIDSTRSCGVGAGQRLR